MTHDLWFKRDFLSRMARSLPKRINAGLARYFGVRLVRTTELIVDLRAVTANPVEATYRSDNRPFLLDVDLEHCRNLHTAAFPCTAAAGNPFVLTLVEHQKGTCSGYEHSPLRLFHERWHPANAAEVLGLNPDEAHPELAKTGPLGFVLPWMSGSAQEHASHWAEVVRSDYVAHGFALDASHGWKAWGPLSDAAGRAEYARLIRTYESVKGRGYRRSNGPDGDITGTALVAGRSSRVMINTGQHRVAALAALAYPTAPVRITSVVRRCEVEAWPNVLTKLFTTDQALTVFDQLFDGRQPATASTSEERQSSAIPTGLSRCASSLLISSTRQYLTTSRFAAPWQKPG